MKTPLLPKTWNAYGVVLNMCMVLFGITGAHQLHAQCGAVNLFVNPDFSGIEGEAVVATGWIGNSTPDLNDENGPLNTTSGYLWVGTPLASPTGGTWQNLAGTESLEQTVPTTIGQVYSICFDYARQGIYYPNQFVYDSAFAIEIYLNNLYLYTTAYDTSGYTWESACTGFVAADTVSVITLGAPAGFVYGAIDNACLAPDLGQGLFNGYSAPPLLFHPNPAKDRVRVAANSALLRATATDVAGRVLPLRTDGQWIDLSTISAGFHIVHCWMAGRTYPSTGHLVISGE